MSWATSKTSGGTTLRLWVAAMATAGIVSPLFPSGPTVAAARRQAPPASACIAMRTGRR